MERNTMLMGTILNANKGFMGRFDYGDVINMLVSTMEGLHMQKFVANIMMQPEVQSTMAKAASSTGKYHPDASNGEYGLLRHTMMALLALDTFISFYKPQEKLSDSQADICRAAIILHDAWKYTDIAGTSSNYTTKEHGFVGARNIMRILENVTAEESMLVEHQEQIHYVASCVRYHMSNWCHKPEDVAYVRSGATNLERVVMLCDFIASNKQLLDFEKYM